MSIENLWNWCANSNLCSKVCDFQNPIANSRNRFRDLRIWESEFRFCRIFREFANYDFKIGRFRNYRDSGFEVLQIHDRSRECFRKFRRFRKSGKSGFQIRDWIREMLVCSKKLRISGILDQTSPNKPRTCCCSGFRRISPPFQPFCACGMSFWPFWPRAREYLCYHTMAASCLSRTYVFLSGTTHESPLRVIRVVVERRYNCTWRNASIPSYCSSNEPSSFAAGSLYVYVMPRQLPVRVIVDGPQLRCGTTIWEVRDYKCSVGVLIMSYLSNRCPYWYESRNCEDFGNSAKSSGIAWLLQFVKDLNGRSGILANFVIWGNSIEDPTRTRDFLISGVW